MATKTPEAQALAFVKKSAKTAKTWVDIHNAFFGINGKFQQLFPTSADRSAFAKTAEFAEISEIIDAKSKSSDEPLPEASGKFLVRLPKSLHAALMVEAAAENVSLNQLCMAKLATQLRAQV